MDEFNELVKLWIKPEYGPMLLALTITLKYVVVPLVKTLFPSGTNGYTPLRIAWASAFALAFVYRAALLPSLAWTAETVSMTVLVAIFAAVSAIGLNTTVQAVKGADVSIVSKPEGY